MDDDVDTFSAVHSIESAEKRVHKFNSKRQKTCPFCGGMATAHWRYDDNIDPYFSIACNKCNAKIESFNFDEVVEMWNSRSNDTNKK